MNLRLYLQTLRWNQVRLAAVAVASIGWGMLLPVIYVQFAKVFKDLANSGAFPKELLNFGSGSLFTLPGALTLGLQHPLTIAFVGIFAVGSTVSAIAGEREAGTLEVLLSRPISRRSVYITLALASATLVAIVLLALLGDVSGFVRAIASPSLEDLTIEPARLEEAFLEYYAGDEASEEMRG